MRSRAALVVTFAALAAFISIAMLSPRSAAQSPFGDADAEPAPFNPQMAALMSNAASFLGSSLLPRSVPYASSVPRSGA